MLVKASSGFPRIPLNSCPSTGHWWPVDGPVEQLRGLNHRLQFATGRMSARLLDKLQLMAKSTVNKEIAAELLIGESTVKTHIIHIFNKLGVKGRTEAVAEAARRGVIRL